MPDLTIPDALSADLKSYYLAVPLPGADLTEERIRFRSEVDEMPSPRLVILPGTPRFVLKMDGTARVPMRIEYVTSMHRVDPGQHRLIAGLLDQWWRTLCMGKRRQVIATRIYLHDLVITQPETITDTQASEQITAIRGEMVVTLVA